MFADENEFRKAVAGMGIDDDPRPAHQEELRRRMLRVFDDAAAGDVLSEESGRCIRLGRKLMRNRIVQVGAAAVAASCVLAVVLWSLGPGAGVALATVQKIVEDIRTVSFELTAYRDSQSEGTAKVMFMEPGKMRAEWPGMIGIFDWNQGKILVLGTEDKSAHLTVVSDMENPYQRNWLGALKTIVGCDAAKELGWKQLFGREAKGWEVPDDGGVCAVWADAKTGELLQVEFVRGRNKMVMTHFVLNPELNESLFVMTPPDGYTLESQVQMTESDPSEADIIILLRAWVSGNGGQFPDRLDPGKFAIAAAKADWQGLGIDSQEKSQKAREAISRAFYLLHSWKLEWGYVGKGVKLGQADHPVFWHRAAGAEMYRVIYADFTVVEVSAEKLKEVIGEDPAAGGR